MSIDTGQSLENVPDVRHRVRRLHWFQQSFKNEAAILGTRYNLTFQIDDRALVKAFFSWATFFEAQRGDAKRDRSDFAIFAGGLMLRELLRAVPAKCRAKTQYNDLGAHDPIADICAFWPDGYLYTTFCMNLVQTILKQDFGICLAPYPRLDYLPAWHSFRENIAEDSSLAVPFFDLLLGKEPNWNSPQHFHSRPEVQRREALAAGCAMQM